MRLSLLLLLGIVLAGLAWLALDSGERRGRAATAGVGVSERASAVRELARPEGVPAEIAAPAQPAPGAELDSAERRAPEPASTNLADLPPTSLGRLVDEATLEPIPEALVATSRNNDWTDANGWFDTGDALDGLDELLVVNVARGTATHTIPRATWTRLARGWQIPFAIGPTYRLRVRGVDERVGEAWEGRLVQEEHEDERWFGLRNGSPPYLRYGDPLRGLEPSAKTWLELRSQDGLHEGRAEVHALRGVQEVEVECVARAAVFGFVFDERGTPRAQVSVEAVQLSEARAECAGTVTGANGRYQLSAASPGRMQLVFTSSGSTRRERLQLDTPRGLTRAPDVVVPAASGGAVAGSLRSPRPRQYTDKVLVRALDGSGFVLSAMVGLQTRDRWSPVSGPASPTSSDGPFTMGFRLDGVPAGRYEVSIAAADGQRWLPSRLVIEAPAGGLAFQLDEAPPPLAYHLEVRDAESGATLEGPEASVSDALGAPAWYERLAPGAPLLELSEPRPFGWSVKAPGYASASGTERDFQGDGARRTLTVALRRGFAARLRLYDWSQSTGGRGWTHAPSRGWNLPGPAGVQVFADGALVVTSDERGIATFDLAAEPKRIELRLPGWRVIESRDFANGKLRGVLETEIWMVRE